jgi:hypothetical protein
MSKRNTVRVTVLSAFALTMICLLSAYAQKAPEATASSVKPVRGIDVVVMKDPGNSAARTGTTNEKGEVEFVGLEPGKYSLTIVDPSNKKKVHGGSQGGDTDVHQNYLVEITGLANGPLKREWNVTESKFAMPWNATARATTAPSYEDKINFEIGGASPIPVLKVSISKSRSNVKNNAIDYTNATPLVQWGN